MAKKSSVEKNNKRIRMTALYAQRRADLKKASVDLSLSLQDRMTAQAQLNKLPKNSSAIRIRNRCSQTGRARGYMRFFGISRIVFRELASAGLLPGVRKASW
ncbi:MAG: 30S ribosomal protein S14 [Candidatus Chromulinivorax sp.]